MKLFSNTLLLAIFAFSSLLSANEDSVPAYNFVGTHFMASYKECNVEALTDLPKLKEALVEAAKASGATVLDTVDYTFEPDGLTMVVLLSESHASIHTYPEHRACFVDLFTCGHKCSATKFDEALRAYLEPQKVSGNVAKRN